MGLVAPVLLATAAALAAPDPLRVRASPAVSPCAKLTTGEDSVMTSQSFCLDSPGTWILILGIGLACVSMAQAAEPAATPDRRPGCYPASPPMPHCRPARANNPTDLAAPTAAKQVEAEEPYGILPEHVTIEQKIEKVRRDMKRSGLPPEMIEELTKDMEKDLREDAARPKSEPLMTGILPGDVIGSSLGAGSSIYLFENGWGDNVNGKEVMVYAGSMRRDPESDTTLNPETAHGFVIIVKGQPGKPDATWNQVYTPTAVGSLHITSAKGNVLTLESRQGNWLSGETLFRADARAFATPLLDNRLSKGSSIKLLNRHQLPKLHV